MSDTIRNVYTLKPILSEDDFKKAAIGHLLKRDTTPFDIVDCEFTDIKLSYSEHLECKITIEHTYSTEEKYFYVRNNNISDFQGSFSYRNSDYYSEPLYKGVELSDENVSVKFNQKAFYNEFNELSSHLSDFTASDDIDCYRVPYYTAKFIYGGKEFEIVGAAYKKDKFIVHSFHVDGSTAIKNTLLKQTVKSKALSKISQIAFYILGPAAFILSTALNLKWLIILPFIAFAASMILPILHKKDCINVIENYRTERNKIISQYSDLSSTQYEFINQLENEMFTFKFFGPSFYGKCVILGMCLIALLF